MRLIGVTCATALVAMVGMLVPAAGPVDATPVQRPIVIGGQPSGIEASPWQVALIQNGAMCGGSLIAETWVVTAAHCLQNAAPADVAIFTGISVLSARTEAQQVPVAAIIMHPQWDANTYANDIALVQLARPVASSALQRPISLPTAVDVSTWPSSGTPSTISGWGATNLDGGTTDQLLRASILIMTGPGDPNCGKYGGSYQPAMSICAGVPSGGIDTCYGDSGGPLVVDVAGTAVLAGLTSTGSDCGLADYPGIYTRITTYIPWMAQYVPTALALPSPPLGVTATAIAGRRSLVQWQVPISPGGAPVSGYTVTAAPEGASCSTSGETTCAIEGLVAGRGYTFTVTALTIAGSSAASAPSALVTAVDGTTRVGVDVRQTAVVRWSGLRRTATQEVSLGVQPASAGLCRVSARGIRALRPGVCVVRVTLKSKVKRTSALVRIGMSE